jgi:hypothetical protein
VWVIVKAAIQKLKLQKQQKINPTPYHRTRAYLISSGKRDRNRIKAQRIAPYCSLT